MKLLYFSALLFWFSLGDGAAEESPYLHELPDSPFLFKQAVDNSLFLQHRLESSNGKTVVLILCPFERSAKGPSEAYLFYEGFLWAKIEIVKKDNWKDNVLTKVKFAIERDGKNKGSIRESENEGDEKRSLVFICEENKIKFTMSQENNTIECNVLTK